MLAVIYSNGGKFCFRDGKSFFIDIARKAAILQPFFLYFGGPVRLKGRAFTLAVIYSNGGKLCFRNESPVWK